MLRVEFGHEEGRIGTMDIGRGSQLDRIAEEREVEIGTEVKEQIARIRTYHITLDLAIEMEGLALCLTDLTTNGEIALCPFVHEGNAVLDVGQLVRVVVVGDKSLQTSLHVFIEAFEQGDGEGVLNLCMLHLIIDGVVTVVQSLIVERIAIIAIGCLVRLVDMIMVVEVERVDKAGDRHVLALHGGIDRILNGLGTVQTVDGCLTFYLDAGGIGSQTIYRSLCRLLACNESAIRTTTGFLVVTDIAPLGTRTVCIGGVGSLTLLLLLLRFLSKLTGFNLFLRHLDLPVETDVIAMGK